MAPNMVFKVWWRCPLASAIMNSSSIYSEWRHIAITSFLNRTDVANAANVGPSENSEAAPAAS